MYICPRSLLGLDSEPNKVHGYHVFGYENRRLDELLGGPSALPSDRTGPLSPRNGDGHISNFIKWRVNAVL